MIALLLLHLLAGVALLAAGGRLGRSAYAVAALPLAATLAWLLVRHEAVASGIDEVVDWVPDLGIALDLRVDGFSALVLALVAAIGILVVAYSARYFDAPPPRLLGLLTLFAGAMTGLVVADDLLVLYGFWELTSVASFLLIGDRHTDPKARAAALQALLVTGAGALCMLAGFIVLGQAAGTYELSAILADPPEGPTVTVALVLVLLGAFAKSAQVPFHGWLPAAMVAPTPVSAYLHSATMVKAGVYLIARLAPTFAVAMAMWRPLVAAVGITTMVLGGLRALRATDLKLLLAMGTISQLGLLVALLGWGSPEAMVAGSALLLAHGAFKAAAFMAVGILDHGAGTRDVRHLPRPGPGWAATTAVIAVAAASMAGLPPLLGFVAKEEAFDALPGWVLAGAVGGTVLTVAYSWRFAAGATGRLADDPSRSTADHPPAASFVAPGLVLTVATVGFGLWPALLDGLVGASARALTASDVGADLALWHGVGAPLVLSVVAVGGGVALIVAARRFHPSPRPVTGTPMATRAYRSTLRAVDAVADRVTAVAQPGSLPVYLGVIVLTAAVVPSVLLLSGSWEPVGERAWTWPEIVELPVHVPLAALLVAAALAAAIVRRRFAGALLLGLVGYLMAGLFVVQGAPDLALTQVAIETLTTVLFVLVLRRLPDRFERTRIARRPVRLAIAVVVGAAVFAFTLAVGPLDPSTPVSDEMVDDALPEADGANVVNVILVDFRGFDTLGEITVLTAAAIGTVALARAGRRARRGDAAEPAPPAVPLARLITIDVSVRVVFAAVMVGSLWLLFAGHNQPGGGFVGGIVAGAAIALRYVQGGLPEVRRLSRGQPWMLLGAGLLISATTALVPLLAGGAVLESGALTLDPPLFGSIKLTSALAFDIGVYLVVIGVAMMVFESFGDERGSPA